MAKRQDLINNALQKLKNTAQSLKRSAISNAQFKPGTSAYSITQPLRDIAPSVGSFPIYKPAIDAGKRLAQASIQEMRNPSKNILGFAKNITPPLISTGINTAGAIYAAPKTLLASAGLSGGLSTMMDRTNSPVKSFVSGAMSGIERTVPISAIGGISNPAISGIASNINTPFTNPFILKAIQGGATGLMNIPEGMAMKKSVTDDPYNKTDAAIDFGMGVMQGIMGSKAKVRVKGAVGRTPNILDPEDAGDYHRAIDILKDKKASPDKLKQAKNVIFTLAERYISPKDRPDGANVKTLIKLIGKKADESNVYFGNSPFAMSFAGKSPKAGSVEQLNEQAQGFRPGLRQEFDTAMFTKNKEEVKRLLPEVPEEYKIRFKSDIDNIIGLTPEQKKSVRKLPGIMYSTSKRIAEGTKKPEAILKQAKAEIGRKDDIKTTFKQGFDKFYTNWVNKFYPVEKLTSDIEKSSGIKIKTKDSPVYAIKRLLGAGGTAELRHKKQLEPIISKLGDVDKSDFDIFLKAKRDMELAGRGIYGSDAEVAEQRLRALAQKYDVNKLDGIAEELYEYQRQGLEKLKQAGFLSDEAIKNITSKNQKYVPFERIRDEIDNYLGLPTSKLQQTSNMVKKIKGSNKAIESPLESIIGNTYKIEAAVAKNNVARSIVNLSKVSKQFGDLFEKVKTSEGDTITVWENGKKQYYKAPKEVVEVVKGLNEENADTLTKLLSAPASFFRQQTTGRNPAFFIPNIVRDQFDAAVNSKYGYRPFIDYLDGLSHLIKYKYGGGDDLVEKWYNSGGSIFFENMGGRKAIKAQIKDATKQRGLIEKGIKAFVSGIDTLSEFSEKPTRIGLFKRALKATGDENIAAFESREATIDFARMGAKMRVANSLIPFLNVQVQGFDKMIRSAKENPGKVSMLLAGYALLPQTLVSMYNNYYHGEDYAQVPDFEKGDNFILMTGGRDRDGMPTYVKLPKGHIQQVVTSPTDNFITWMAGNNPQSFQQLALSMISGTIPPLQEGDNMSDIATRTIGGLTPQAAKPLLETTLNKDTFKNRPIVDPYTEKLPAAAQFYATTPERYKVLGKQLNLSPAKIQHFLEGYGGGIVKEGNNLMTTAQDIAGGNTPNPNKIPIARRFFGSYSGFDTERPGDGDIVDPDFAIKQREAKLKLKSKAKSVPLSSTKKVKMLDKSDEPKRMEAGIFDGWFKKSEKIEEEPTAVSYLDEKGTIKTIDYGKALTMTSGSSYEKIKKEKEVFKIVSDVLESPIEDSEKDTILKRLGVKKEDALYYSMAQETDDLKSAYINDEVQSFKDRKDLLMFLARGRKQINGKMIVSDGVLTDLVKSKVITDDDYDKLKNIVFKDGQPFVKMTGRGKGAKIKKIKLGNLSPNLRATLSATKTPSIDTGRLRIQQPQMAKIPQIYQMPQNLLS